MIRSDEEILKLEHPIVMGDAVFHQISKLYFICENKKMARWMNMNPNYVWTVKDSIPKSYFEKV
jgi:hypothetical protein